MDSLQAGSHCLALCPGIHPSLIAAYSPWLLLQTPSDMSWSATGPPEWSGMGQMTADLLWSGAWSGRTKVPTRPPELTLQHEEGQRVHCQGTFNQRPLVPFYHLFKVFWVLLRTKMWGVLVTVLTVLVCAGHWSPPSWKTSVLSTLLRT